MDVTQPSPITPEAWRRLLDALDAGTPPYAACRYAGISPAVWERERQRIPEFGITADRIEASGLVAAWRFLQGAAATEWRASLELIKLFGATRGREVVRIEGPEGDDPHADVTPEDVAAVIRVLRSREVSESGAADGHRNGHADGVAGSNGAEAVIE
jgi:hypothetical protein